MWEWVNESLKNRSLHKNLKGQYWFPFPLNIWFLAFLSHHPLVFRSISSHSLLSSLSQPSKAPFFFLRSFSQSPFLGCFFILALVFLWLWFVLWTGFFFFLFNQNAENESHFLALGSFHFCVLMVFSKGCLNLDFIELFLKKRVEDWIFNGKLKHFFIMDFLWIAGCKRWQMVRISSHLFATTELEWWR